MGKALIAPWTRKMITENIERLQSQKRALGQLKYDIAHEHIQANDDILSDVMKTLPGGYAGECIHCHEATGRSEIHSFKGNGIECAYCIDSGHELPTITPERSKETA